MEVHKATADDIDGIRRVARDSLIESYGHALDESVIEESVDQWYGDEFIAEMDSEEAVFFVASVDGTVAGFSQSYLVGKEGTTADINWLHVSPEFRGESIGSRLLSRTEETLVDNGVTRLMGNVLEINEPGAEFYSAHGYEEADTRELEIGDETYTERVFVKRPGTESEAEVPLEPRSVGEETMYVAFDESNRGSKAPLYVSYLDEGRTQRYGYFCGNCEGFELSMDSMGKVLCNDCGNKRQPTRWDASYL